MGLFRKMHNYYKMEKSKILRKILRKIHNIFLNNEPNYYTFPDMNEQCSSNLLDLHFKNHY